MRLNKKIKIPKGQQLWERYIKNDTIYFIVTSNIMRTNYYLYKVNNDNTITKIKTGTTPLFKNEIKELWSEKS